MALHFQRQHRAEVQCIASIGFEGANPSFAEDYILVSFRHDVFGGHQELFDRGAHAAFEQHRFANLPHRFQ